MKNSRLKYIILVLVLCSVCLEGAYAQPGCEGCDKKAFAKKNRKTKKYSYNHYANNSTAGNHGEEGEDSYDDWGDDGDDDYDEGGGDGSGDDPDPYGYGANVQTSGSNLGKCEMLKFASETIALQPNDRARTTIGIGEEVKVRFDGLTECGGKLEKWSIENIGTEAIKNTVAIIGINEFQFNAGFVPGIVKIKVMLSGLKGDCKNCPTVMDIPYTVIAPSEVNYKVVYNSQCPGSLYVPKHNQYAPSAGVWASIYIGPSSVNFYNISYKEGYVDAVTTGDDYWKQVLSKGGKIPSHPASATFKLMLTQVLDGYGTEANSTDEINIQFPCRQEADPTNYGRVLYNIPQFYERKVNGKSTLIKFCEVRQFGTNSGNTTNPEFILVKETGVGSGKGVFVKNYLEDPDRCPETSFYCK
jgi:hypothetical protein